MRNSVTLWLSAGLVAALPQPQGTTSGTSLLSGLLGASSAFNFNEKDANDVNTGPCRDVFLIVARGSEEPGNIGVTVGPPLCKGMRAKYGDKVGCQGIDPKGYSAGILDNMMPKGTADLSITTGIKEFTKAVEKCPNAILVGEGYSQGAAMLHNIVPLLPQNVTKQLAAVILFGDTKNKQFNGTIPGFPKEKLASFCTPEDGVCWGKLEVTGGHLAYLQNGDIQKAIDFAIKKADEALKAKPPK